MKYRDLLINLDKEGYDIPLPATNLVINDRDAMYKCRQCGGKRKYVSSTKKNSVIYRGFLVCQKCSEVAEILVTDF